MRGSGAVRTSLAGTLTALLLVASTSMASAAVLVRDGFGGTSLRARWKQVDSRWWVGAGALHAQKRSVDHRTHIGYAVANLGGAHPSGVRVSSRIRLSPGQSNVGLTAPFRNAGNNLFCKVEVTPGHPQGEAAIGRRRNAGTPSILVRRGGLGLERGAVYRLTIERRGRAITCAIRRNGGVVTAFRYRMTPGDVHDFGGGTMAGVRIKVVDGGGGKDEDDGRSRFLDFRATTI
jgi:hypothetical protein